MNKKIMLLSIIAVLTQNVTHTALVPGGASAVTKGLPAVKVPGFNLPGAAAKPAVSIPMVQLTPAQIETLTSDLSQMGGKQYLSQIQLVWQDNPELLYNAQQAIQNADLEKRRQYANKIIESAKQFDSKKTATFSVQDAITHNRQLENLINTKLSENLFNIGTTMSSLATSPKLGNESSTVKKDFYDLQNDFGELQTTAQEILTNTNLTPQQAASKIGELINKSFDPTEDVYNAIKIAEKAATSAKDATVKQAMNETKNLLETTKDLLESTKIMLQKTAPVGKKSATYAELKNLVESINAQTESSSSIVPTIPGAIANPIPMPTEIKPFFEAQKASINTHIVKLSNVMKQLFAQDIPNLGLSAQEKEIFDLEKANITTNIQLFNKVLNHVKGLSDNPNAINEFKMAEEQLSVIVTELIYSLEKLNAETKNILPSQRKAVIESIQAMVREIMAIYSNVRTTLLVLEESHANKEIMAQIKQNINLGEFVGKTVTDLAQVQKTAQQLATILSTNAAVLKTDKAPASMLEVFESKMAQYLTTFEELKTISKIEGLGALQVKLKAQEKDLLTTLDRLFSKLAWLPTSTAKNQALDAFRKLKSEFLANKKAIDNIFEKAASIQEKHTFIILKQNELEMGMLTVIDKTKALRLSIKKTIPQDKLTSQETQALSRLDQMLSQALSALSKIENAQTSLELDQLTKEFFKVKDLSPLSKKPSSLVPVGQSSIALFIPKYEETLNETLKLFGLKVVLGLTATGVVSWLVQPADKDEKDVTTPTTGSDIPSIQNIDISSAEFIQKSGQIVQETQNLDQIPTADLDKTIQTLEMDMQILSFTNFKKEAAIFWNNFSKAINKAIADATSKFNQYKVNKLKEFKDWSEETLEPLLENKLPKGTKLPKENEFKSEYEEIIALLKKYSKQ